MKRINLIPLEERRSAGGASHWLKSIFFTKGKIVMPVVVILLAVMFGQKGIRMHLCHVLENMDQQITSTQKDYDKQHILIQDLEVAQKAVEQDIKHLQENIRFIQKTQLDGAAWTRVLVSLCDILPDEVWLKKMSMDLSWVTLNGQTDDHARVSYLMQVLEKSDSFDNTGFHFTEKDPKESPSTVHFEVMTHLVHKGPLSIREDHGNE